jgi:hypothetical protein
MKPLPKKEAGELLGKLWVYSSEISGLSCEVHDLELRGILVEVAGKVLNSIDDLQDGLHELCDAVAKEHGLPTPWPPPTSFL